MAEGKKQKLEQEEIEIMKKLKTTTQMHEQMVENETLMDNILNKINFGKLLNFRRTRNLEKLVIYLNIHLRELNY